MLGTQNANSAMTGYLNKPAFNLKAFPTTYNRPKTYCIELAIILDNYFIDCSIKNGIKNKIIVNLDNKIV